MLTVLCFLAGAQLTEQSIGADDEPFVVQPHARRGSLGVLVHGFRVLWLQAQAVEAKGVITNISSFYMLRLIMI